MTRAFLLGLAIAIAPLSACSNGEEVAEASRQIETVPLIDPNTATEAELAAVDGIDNSLATAIVANRPYSDSRSFYRVVSAGLDGEARDGVLDAVFMPLSLNSAAEDDFKMIPGIGDRMAHEFVEYRPYGSIAQWEGEMGKYVDAAEVARMRRYVVLD